MKKPSRVLSYPLPDTIPQTVRAVARAVPNTVAQMIRPGKGGPFAATLYKEYWSEVARFGAGLLSLGLKRGEHVGIISDNRREWLVVDMAILGMGAVDIPRGADSTQDEVAYILKHADCAAVVAEDAAQTEKILAGLSGKTSLKFLIVLDDSLGPTRKAPSLQQLNYSEVLALGTRLLSKEPNRFEKEVDAGKSDDLATIIYTSGTTGEPKGVMLTHRSFIFQAERALEVIGIRAGDTFLTVLPIWHSYERAIEYIVLCTGAVLGYSKPIGKIMLEDMTVLQPHWFISVPRIWESVRASIYRNVKARGPVAQSLFDFFVNVGSLHADLLDKFLDRWPRFSAHWAIPTQIWTALPLVVLWPLKLLGGLLMFGRIKALLGHRFIAGISGGGALPAHVDGFFRAIDVLVLEGYGLTETGPVLGVRKQKRPVPHTVGKLFRDIEIRIVDEETGKAVGTGHQGELWVKSPQVMLGYYKRPEATAAVLKDGWLNTGDLVRATVRKEMQIVGRSKDTIVLRGGENIEPEPIEKRLLQSELIEHVMVVGQDQKYLGALIVPNFELIEQFAKERRITYIDKEELLGHAQILELVHEVVQHLVNPRSGFKSFERVFKFTLLPKAFEVGSELTAKLSLRRNVTAQKYAEQIASLFTQKESEIG
jgi:long-chain acyl-CoA synthetase